MSHKALSVLALILGLGLVAGCGDGSKPAGNAPGAPPASGAQAVAEKAVTEGPAAQPQVQAAGTTQPAPARSAAPPPAPAIDGAPIYKLKCSGCHGQDGRGSVAAPSLVANRWIREQGRDGVVDTLLKGRSGPTKRFKEFAGGMPAYRMFTAAELDAVSAHVVGLAATD